MTVSKPPNVIYQSPSDIRMAELEMDESLSLYNIVLLSDHVEDLNANKKSAKANLVNVGKKINAKTFFSLRIITTSSHC